MELYETKIFCLMFLCFFWHKYMTSWMHVTFTKFSISKDPARDGCLPPSWECDLTCDPCPWAFVCEEVATEVEVTFDFLVTGWWRGSKTSDCWSLSTKIHCFRLEEFFFFSKCRVFHLYHIRSILEAEK